MALKGRKLCVELIHHLVRRIQYCCDAYQRVLEKSGLRVIMTQNADNMDNVITECINDILKYEFELTRWALDRAVLTKTVRQSIDIYNTIRPHFSCGLLTPEQMH